MSAKVREVLMTPDWAKRLLAGNRDNRRIRPTVVARLATELTEGRWVITPDAIAVSPSGRLLNGQHRLAAIVQADRSAHVLLAENMDEESFLVTDRGVKRTISDVTGLPAGMVADIALLRFAMNTSITTLAPQIANDIADFWSPAWERIDAVPGGGAGKGSGNNAALRVAVGLRWATCRPEHREYVLRSYQQILHNDMEHASRAARALWKRTQGGTLRGGAGNTLNLRLERSVTAFVYLDPARADREPLVRSMPHETQDYRALIRALPDAYAAGPAKDGHPYVWPALQRSLRPLAGAAAQKKQERLLKAKGAVTDPGGLRGASLDEDHSA